VLKKYSFEKLTAWQDAKELALLIFVVTKSFPDEEKFGIISQIRRASISVCCNLSEGTSRWSNKEKNRFLEISFGSLMEVLNCALIASKLNYLNTNTLNDIRILIDKISNKINALRKSFS
jgi:four helix bundle protein